MSGTYNAATALLAHNLAARPEGVALATAGRTYTFADVAARADAIGQGLLDHGLRPGDRVALCLPDGEDLFCGFIGAIKAGLLPMPLNTLLTAEDYAHILSDSGATAVIVTQPLADLWIEAQARSDWRGVLWIDAPPAPAGIVTLQAHAAAPDDAAFLLYSSGSTGRPKGVVHRHESLRHTARCFGQGVLGLREDDVVYSAAKLFFAYGLGNGLTFPLSVGATSVLRPERVTPEVVWRTLREHAVTVFCGVPTLFASLLASDAFPARGDLKLRLCTSAGEPLPAEIARAWTERTGVEIIDGIGSTEMLHVFLSNRPGAVRHGVTGRPAPDYEVRLIAEDGGAAGPGELGELHVRGPSAAAGYWNNPKKTAETFVDGWVRTGDQFRRDDDGDYVYCGRSDDMLKVSGIWVSPAEVEHALLGHASVYEAAVIGVQDCHGLTKTRAYVVLRPGLAADHDLEASLKTFCKARLAPHKYPREIAFVGDLPKTATGKIRRHVLREQAAV